MKLFNEDGDEYEVKNLYDEDGNLIGNFLEKTTENISEAFSTSWLLGLLLLIFAPAWGIVYILFVLLFKFFIFLLKTLWWIIKLPFYLIFYKSFPKF